MKAGTHAGQRTAFRSQFSPTLWVPEIELRSPSLAASGFHQVSHLLSLKRDDYPALNRLLKEPLPHQNLQPSFSKSL